ncbi:MAG: hemolysin family protein [Nitrospinaceae bacterium]|nr:hemolysin family protein [Nitrospinaceae bacterium]
MDDSILLRLSFLAVFLVFSAFFSACEAAFFSLTSLQLNDLKEQRGRAGHVVNSLLENPRGLLITIYIGNELINIAVSVITTSIAITLFGSYGVGIAVGVGTFLLLVFGEIIPKSMSLKFAQTYAVAAAYPLKLFANIVQPIQKFLTRVAENFVSMLGFSFRRDQKTTITDDEFRTMVQMSEGEGAIDSEESELIHNVIEFGETTAGEIMTPKIDMFTLMVDDKLEDILPRIVENFYSRVPVYNKDDENIAGILFTKDLNRLKHLPPEKFSLKSVLRPALSVPQSKKIKELLQEFKKEKRHMAIVLDEYGSLCGLVTLEDILEELVGEIDSEMRLEEKPLIQINDTNFRLLATYPISEFNEHFHAQLPEDEYETLGGFVFGLFGRVPRSGEAITHDRFKFLVEKKKGARILNLHLTVMNPTVPASNGKPREESTTT